MIVTLTPSPSVDLTYEVDELVPGELTRATAVRADPGGKGLNVARALSGAGMPVLAVLPVGGRDGDRLLELAARQEVPTVAVPVDAGTRVNVTVAAPGVTTKINAPVVSGPGDAARVLDAVAQALEPGAGGHPDPAGSSCNWLVVSGAVPPGWGPDAVRHLARLAAARGVRVALDTSGPAFAAGCAGGDVALVAPNAAELAQLVGTAVETVGDAVRAARPFLAPDAVALVTLGEHGALAVTTEQWWWAGAPPVVAASTVGAGDAALAGYLAAHCARLPLPQCLVHAAAWGRAAAGMPGTAMPAPADVNLAAVRLVAAPDLDTRLASL